MAKVMSVNAGSSSLKFKLFDMPSEKVICSGMAERIGHDDGIFDFRANGNKNKKIVPLPNHAVGVQMLLDSLISEKVIASLDEIVGIGHRIVQGGKYYSSSVVITKDVENHIEELISLAPLHNKPNLVAYRAFRDVLPNIKHVAVFDTAFHQTMEPVDYIFPIPYEYYEKYDIRRYGFHGTSHQYLAQEAMKYLEGVPHPRVITCHLGSGASISAIKDGKCVATSMGLTPLGGIMMGTRSGDIDPSVVKFMCDKSGKSLDEIYSVLNKQSGLLGISEVSNDSRDILAAADKGNAKALLANQLFVRRVADYIGQYFVRLGGADLIVFSAGIGENAGIYREWICDEIGGALGIVIDKAKNLPLRGVEALLSTPESKVKVAVIPTDEEVMIARDTFRFLSAK